MGPYGLKVTWEMGSGNTGGKNKTSERSCEQNNFKGDPPPPPQYLNIFTAGFLLAPGIQGFPELGADSMYFCILTSLLDNL